MFGRNAEKKAARKAETKAAADLYRAKLKDGRILVLGITSTLEVTDKALVHKEGPLKTTSYAFSRITSVSYDFNLMSRSDVVVQVGSEHVSFEPVRMMDPRMVAMFVDRLNGALA